MISTPVIHERCLGKSDLYNAPDETYTYLEAMSIERIIVF